MPPDLSRLRLHSQRISTRSLTEPAAVVAHLGAVQAQDYLGSLWGIGLRARVTEADVERAVEKRLIVRTWPMRRTLHFVASADVRWMLRLLASRSLRLLESRHRVLELEQRDFERCRRAATARLAGGVCLTRQEIYGVFTRAGVVTTGVRGLHLLAQLAQEGLICFGPRQGKQQTFVLLDEWVPAARVIDGATALGELAFRYFRSHGPATAHDLAWWAGLTLRDVRAGIEEVSGKLVHETINRQTFYRTSDTRARASRVAYLLPPFDEFTVAYRDRSAVIADRFRTRVQAGGIFRPVVAIDGQLVGTWRRTFVRDGVRVHLEPFGLLTASERRPIERAAERYAEFLGRPLASVR